MADLLLATSTVADCQPPIMLLRMSNIDIRHLHEPYQVFRMIVKAPSIRKSDQFLASTRFRKIFKVWRPHTLYDAARFSRSPDGDESLLVHCHVTDNAKRSIPADLKALWYAVQQTSVTLASQIPSIHLKRWGVTWANTGQDHAIGRMILGIVLLSSKGSLSSP